MFVDRESHGSLDVAFSTCVGVPTKPWSTLCFFMDVVIIYFKLINGSVVEGNQSKMTWMF